MRKMGEKMMRLEDFRYKKSYFSEGYCNYFFNTAIKNIQL